MSRKNELGISCFPFSVELKVQLGVVQEQLEDLQTEKSGNAKHFSAFNLYLKLYHLFISLSNTHTHTGLHI